MVEESARDLTELQMTFVLHKHEYAFHTWLFHICACHSQFVSLSDLQESRGNIQLRDDDDDDVADTRQNRLSRVPLVLQPLTDAEKGSDPLYKCVLSAAGF